MDTATDTASTERLRSDMSAGHLTPLWELEGEIMSVLPAPRTRAHLWRWADLYDIAERAGRLVPVERGGDRRAIALSNPGLGGLPYATATLWAAVQWLNGREVAPAHRHTSQAVRFIIDGAGSYSTVEGDRVFLERGDLVLTPPWLWHDHGSESDERAVWMDALDIPVNNFLDASFFEPHPEASQAVTAERDASVLKYGVGQLRPAWEPPSRRYPALTTFKWADTRRALDNLARVDADPFDDVALEYANPHSGRPVMDSFTCWIQLLRPGVRTRAHRHTGSSVYLAFEGRGATVIDGVRFDWEAGDMLTIPSWAAHEHHNHDPDAPAILFSVHDTPLVQAVDKHRVEPLAVEHQEVVATFPAAGQGSGR
jgi:gentisate 1,2-dioxygenase